MTFVGDVGWVKWDPRTKHHYMFRRPDGWSWTACGAWGTAYNTSLLNMVSTPTEKEKCKLCLRVLKKRTEYHNLRQEKVQ